ARVLPDDVARLDDLPDEPGTEPGAHLGGVPQLAVIIVAHDQCAERLPAAPSRVSANDELLLVANLELDPCAAALVGFVAGVGELSHDALQVEAADLGAIKSGSPSRKPVKRSLSGALRRTSARRRFRWRSGSMRSDFPCQFSRSKA